ncbi:MAG: DNA polymerase [Candidatus Saccharibacteria bacterium]|nr:DNA polymerase [Candidatus Saccharibacteria bacterium]
MKRLVLIDGKSVFYRGYYAMGALSLPDGTPTGGVYGFAAIAMEIVKKLEPTKVVVAWDSKTSVAKRRKIYPEYKEGRVKPGEDFYAQIPLLEELVADLGWDFVEVPEYEADDIIGTLSLQADEAELWETYIISSDLDMLQIVDENTHMWRIVKGFSNIEQIDVAEIEAKYGIRKSQFLDFKALKGDASDNIPGVAGVGEKTAANLLNEYGSLDEIYANLDKITGSVKAKLEAGRESAYMSRDLARIMFDAPVKLDEIPDFKLDQAKMIEGLKKLEFNSLIRKFGKGKSEMVSSRDGSLAPVVTGPKPSFSVVTLESPRVIPFLDLPNQQVSSSDLAQDLIVDWDVKALMHCDRKVADEILRGEKFWDLNQAGFLLNPLRREQVDLFEAANTKEICQEQLREFEKYPKLYRVLTELDLPLIPILYKMEKKGMLIDRRYFEGLKNEYAAEVEKLEREIWKLAGKEFNVNSPVQLSEVLFVDLRLPVKGIKKTTRGYSTGAKELDKLKDLHPIIPKLMEYREAAKLLSTYIVPMPELADAEGRIHTTFTQDVTATGRLSSKDPNLQNIPVRTEEGRRIRTGFVAPEGKVLVSADYSQFELRLAAVLAGDTKLIDDFNEGVDIHTKTASEAFRVPMTKVTKAQRRAAKVINFGILYGMSVKGLAEAAKMPIGAAKQFIDNYFELRAPIKKYLEATLKQAREQGYVETFYGRRRPTPDVKSANFVIRQAAERAAKNMPIQGTEADLMKRAMIKVDAALPAGAELVMQVHDSLIVECDKGLVDKVSQVLQREMEAVAPELKIKLALEITIGKNWGEL